MLFIHNLPLRSFVPMVKKKPILMTKLKSRILQSTNCLRIWLTWPIFPKPPSSTIYPNVMSDFWSTPILVSSVSLSIHTSGFQYTTITLLVVTRARESLKCLHISSPFLIMLTMTCWENVTTNLCWLLVSNSLNFVSKLTIYFCTTMVIFNFRWIWCW